MKTNTRYVAHIGVKRRSGRYPWGSRNNVPGSEILQDIQDMKDKGLSETEIATGLGMSTGELRSLRSNLRAEQRASDRAYALRLKDKGLSKVAIGKKLGVNESTVRSLLNPAIQQRANIAKDTAAMLKDELKKHPLLDVGAGAENHIGISKTKLDHALSILEQDGYRVHSVRVEQLGTGKFTRMKILAAPEVTYSYIMKNLQQVSFIGQHLSDTGHGFLGLDPVKSVSSDRVYIRYAEDGGSSKDGTIELRPGVDGLSLGGARYAQVRIGVDDTHFMKGMAVYSDNVPDGYDMVYNVSKKKGTPKESVFKPMQKLVTGEIDTDNPFGTSIKPNGQRGHLNIVNEEGDWVPWSNELSSQVLSKQPISLASKQLSLALQTRQDDLSEIQSLTNPAVKKHLLLAFADNCDSAADQLKAAPLPGQRNHVLLPVPSMKPTEIFAPGYQNGERVALIRHPHGGRFEIPELVVNNKNPDAKNILGGALDAVGIHPSVAEKLSGADFDGDTVLVIPNSKGDIKSAPSLEGLKNFNPKEQYPAYPGMKRMTPHQTQVEMGKISNLITDMTIKGANGTEIASAVRHSMVVIDAEKHNLNFRESERVNGIASLKEKYQSKRTGGASTLISRAKATVRVPERNEYIRVNPKTGEKIYTQSGRMVLKKDGTSAPKMIEVTNMSLKKDAHQLSSGSPIERVYGDHANALKQMALSARREAVNTPNTPYSPTARKAFQKEVNSLNAKIKEANAHRPMERQAQVIANHVYKTKIKDYPDLTPKQKKRLKGQALMEARARYGEKTKFKITDSEWKAIQAGAISTNGVMKVLGHVDMDDLRDRSLPRKRTVMTEGKLLRAQALSDAGYSNSEIANALGVPVTTLISALKK